MDQLILFILLGLGPGALYAGLAQSLVLTHRGAGIINVSAGAMAMWGAYTFYGLRSGHLLLPLYYPGVGGPVPVIPAFLLSVALSALLGALIDVAVFKWLRKSAPLAKLVASVGLLLTVQALIVLRFGGTGQTAPPVLAGGSVHLFGGAVPLVRLEVAGLAVAVGLALTAVYRYSRFGLATRAAQEDEAEAMMSGLSPRRLSLLNTTFASALAGVVGILVAPMTQLDPTTLALAVVPALGAALIARFTSFTVAALAGLGMGALQAVALYLQTLSWFPTSNGLPMPGLADVLFFIVIAAALMWRGKSLPDRGSTVEPRLPPAPAPRRIARPTAIGVAIAAVALLVLPYDLRQGLINTLIAVIACLSLVVLTGYVGQVSLAQFAFAGLSGLVVSKLGINLGIGLPWAPLLGIAAAAVFGLVDVLPAMRVRGVHLAILTLAAAVALQNFGFHNPSWGASGLGSPVSPPKLFGINFGPSGAFPVHGDHPPSPLFGLVCLLVTAVCCVAVANLRRSGLGQRMLAVRSSERAAAAAGISVPAIKVTAFVMSAFLMGVVGVLTAYNFGSVDPANFGIVNTLVLIALAYLGGISVIKGTLIGGLLMSSGVAATIMEDYLGLPADYLLLFAGVSLVLTVTTTPGGIALAHRKSRHRDTPAAGSGTGPLPTVAEVSR
ncbi:ABC transporter permease [Actinomadura opuntiae]|uniref:ABC transporter permease n=1 Tax=Actinomadura sp. OS1-43 TaxID=604315 RepID=UPI00255ACD24|nr:ABC transporter permease [Actinomadura sp. OS1-43]MDL4821093.1 ABC transporter permease [Actinomadura sp. OS1-43]